MKESGQTDAAKGVSVTGAVVRAYGKTAQCGAGAPLGITLKMPAR